MIAGLSAWPASDLAAPSDAIFHKDPVAFAAPLACAVAPRVVVDGGAGSFCAAAFQPGPTEAGHGPGWLGPRTAFHGWIDNLAELASALAADSSASHSPAALYDLALAAWGDDADRKIIGAYSAITRLPDGRLRLVRSPWTAPPLHYIVCEQGAAASSVIGVLFRAGHPREVDFDYLADQLVQDHRALEHAGWYRGVRRVPIGTRVVLSPTGAESHRYYDPLRLPPVHRARDEDYVERAGALLAESVACALAACKRPGVMLSGGLDSALAASTVLVQLPPDQTLPSFTYCPDPAWDGRTPATQFGDERPAVEAFAAMHPRLRPHFFAGGEFDAGLHDILRANDLVTANVANTGKYHAPWQAAAQAGCDWLFNAEFGNFTISNDGRWSYVEYFRTLRWRQLALILQGRAGDSRPLWRKLLALSILPQLPARLRLALRRWVHPGSGDPVGRFSALSPAARRAHQTRAAARGGRALMADYHYDRSREEQIRGIWDSADSGEDLDLAFERLYGLRRRDLMAYRPLIEFCLALPTRQFAHDGVDRWLARRLAKGRMPEAQRLERRMGWHHPDWHAQLSRRRAELADRLERLRDHPRLGPMLDIDRLQALLEDWPETCPITDSGPDPRAFALTRALTTASFVGHAENRNDF